MDMTSKIRPMRPEDLPAVEALYRTVFGEMALLYWQRRFKWQFFQNPGTASRSSEMWVGVRGKEMLGFLAAFPMLLSAQGETIVVLCPCDLMVAPEARGEGLGERLIRTYVDESGGLANALAYSRAAARVYDRLGYHSVYAEPECLRPMHGGKIISAVITDREERSALLYALRPVVAPIATAFASIANVSRRPRTQHSLYTELNPVFNSEFDSLFATVSRELPMSFSRSAPFLYWRFTLDPITTHTVWAARDTSGALVGYAAVCETSRQSLQIGKIMDIYCLPSRAADVVGALVAPILQHFRERGVDLVVSKGLHPSIRAEVRRSLYMRAPRHEMPARFLWSGDEKLANAIYAAANWHLSYADGDEDFVP